MLTGKSVNRLSLRAQILVLKTMKLKVKAIDLRLEKSQTSMADRYSLPKNSNTNTMLLLTNSELLKKMKSK